MQLFADWNVMKNLKKSLDYSIGNTVRIFHNILVIKSAKNRIFRVFGGNLGFAPPRWVSFPLKNFTLTRFVFIPSKAAGCAMRIAAPKDGVVFQHPPQERTPPSGRAKKIKLEPTLCAVKTREARGRTCVLASVGGL